MSANSGIPPFDGQAKSDENKITVSPLGLAEVSAWTAVQCRAFDDPAVDGLLPLIYPPSIPAVTREDFLSERLRIALSSNPSTQCLVARDSSNVIVGLCRWAVKSAEDCLEDEAALEKQIDTFISGYRRTLDATGFVNVTSSKLPAAAPATQFPVNVALAEAYMRALFTAEHVVTEGRPHIDLQLLAVDPAYQRRGVGALMLAPVLAAADAQKLPIFVAASRTGRPLYARLGFKDVQILGFSATDFGSEKEGTHWGMLREAE